VLRKVLITGKRSERQSGKATLRPARENTARRARLEDSAAPPALASGSCAGKGRNGVSGGTARQRRAARRLPAGERRRLRGCFVDSTGDYWATCEEGNDDVAAGGASELRRRRRTYSAWSAGGFGQGRCRRRQFITARGRGVQTAPPQSANGGGKCGDLEADRWAPFQQQNPNL
jgi:hypothetical protein